MLLRGQACLQLAQESAGDAPVQHGSGSKAPGVMMAKIWLGDDGRWIVNRWSMMATN